MHFFLTKCFSKIHTHTHTHISKTKKIQRDLKLQDEKIYTSKTLKGKKAEIYPNTRQNKPERKDLVEVMIIFNLSIFNNF